KRASPSSGSPPKAVEMFAALGRISVRFRFVIAAVYAIGVVPLVILGLPVFERLRAGGFEDPTSESWRVYSDLEREIKVGGGAIPVNMAVATTVEADLKRAEAVAFPITAVLLLFFFGSAASASLPLMLGALSIAFALAVLRVLSGFTPMSIFAVNIITLLGL